MNGEIVDIDPGEWWLVVESIIVHHWEKFLIVAGAYMAYRLALSYIRNRGKS